jgi:hypothetical protein
MVLEVVTEWMFTEPSIMEMIVSVSKALQEYECVGGFGPTIAAEAAYAALEVPAANMEPTADAPAPPPTSESREASLPQSAEAAEAPTSVAETGAAEDVVREAGSSPPRPVAAGTEVVETRAPDEPTAVVQEPVTPKTMRSRRLRGRGRPCCRAQRVVRPRPLSSPTPRGRPLLGLVSTLRTTRRSRCATPWSVG